MANDNKISVDVTITGDGLQQIDKYVQSFDSLRKSVDGLSQPLNSFSGNINALNKNLSNYTDELSKLNSQQNETASTGDKVHNKVSEMSTSFSTGVGVLKLFNLEIRGLYGALTGGLSVIIAFLPEIVNFATAFLKGKDAANLMVNNLKNLNEVMRDSNKDAASETARLNILYKAATNAKDATDGRTKSIQELQKQFPTYFEGLTKEDFLNGKAKKNYDELTKSIVDNAKAKAAMSKIETLTAQQLDIDFMNEKITNAKNAQYKRLEPEKVILKSEMGERVPVALTPLEKQKSLKGKQQDNRNDLKNELDEQNKKKKLLQDQIDYLVQSVGGVKALLNNPSGNKPGGSSNDTHDKSYWEAELEKQQNALDKLDATSKKYKTDARPIIKRIKEINETLSKYSVNNGGISIKTHVTTPTGSNSPKPDTPHSEDLVAAQSITIAQHFENEKKAYDNELALLNDQLSKKLISQIAYNKQSQVLQEQYHQGIGSSVEKFALEDMAKTQKHLKDVAEAEGKLAYDETNVKKAILPGQKLDAEKQLITDKYNYEIVLANGNAEKIQELEIKKQEALTSVTQQYEQQRKEFALNTAQQVADRAFSIIGNNIKTSSDAKIKGLEKDKAGELSNKNLTETQRKAIEDKYQKKEAQEKTKAFKAEQRMSVLQAVVNGALAVTKATAQTGILAPFVIPGIIASTALQIATIVAQKPPAFAKGGRFVSDGRGALLPGYSRTDNTNAFLRSGEAVVVSEAMRNPWARNLVSAINVAHGGRDFSMPNTGRGYAIGGIFTDGGNANRYYNQPVNDAKELANTLAYQMINNFPPIYVDVKDVNNQQNILAQTVNRVNL